MYDSAKCAGLSGGEMGANAEHRYHKAGHRDRYSICVGETDRHWRVESQTHTRSENAVYTLQRPYS